MAGFREFMPGQVWFYYNAQATKELERRKELGSCTSRPVVIIQSAFYPEWNDVVTVCPLTSSDRRSGVYIDTTILKDGSIIEGGTVLPYLVYTIKAKFLFPIITSNHRRRLISLSNEDFQKVKQGYLYHLGEDVGTPDYVEGWKHLTDYDRNIIIQDVRLAINDMEDMVHDTNRGQATQSIKKNTPNPVLKQAPPNTNRVENHMIAALTEYDRDNHTLYNQVECFNSEPLGEESSDDDDPAPAPVTEKQVKREVSLAFTEMDVSCFASHLTMVADGVFPVADASEVFPGSTVLANMELKLMPAYLKKADKYKIMAMTMSDIVHNTGIASTSTASRLRRQLREHYVEEGEIEVDENGKVIFLINEAPEPFYYGADLPINKTRFRRNAKRHSILFAQPKERLLQLVSMNLETIAKELNCPISSTRMLKLDIAMLYPNEIVDYNGDRKLLSELRSSFETEAAKADLSGTRIRYKMWETLSPVEVQEIRSCTKKNMQALARNFGIPKDKARQLRDKIMNSATIIPPLEMGEDECAECCLRVIAVDHFSDLSSTDLYVFCRTDHAKIATYFSMIKSSNTPSKSDIRLMKAKIRKLIVSSIV